MNDSFISSRLVSGWNYARKRLHNDYTTFYIPQISLICLLSNDWPITKFMSFRWSYSFHQKRIFTISLALKEDVQIQLWRNMPHNHFDDVVFFFLWGVFCMSKVLYFLYSNTSFAITNLSVLFSWFSFVVLRSIVNI